MDVSHFCITTFPPLITKELKERIRNIEYILSDEKEYIDLKYEKEQISLDNNNKYSHD